MARQTDFGDTQWKLQMNENKFKNPPKPETNLPLADELLTHCHDVAESKFGASHPAVAKACAAVAFLAVLRDEVEEGKSFLDKALGIFKKVEEGGRGLGAASVSVSLGRLKLRSEADEDEKDEGLEDIKFGAEFYLQVGDMKAFSLFTEMAKIHEQRGGCVDFDVVECLENAVKASVACYGEIHPTTLKALKGLGEKSEEGGDFDRSKAALRRALRVAESLYGDGDGKCLKIKKRIETVGVEEAAGEMGGLDLGGVVEEEEEEDLFKEERGAAKAFLDKETKREEERLKVKKKKKKKKAKKVEVTVEEEKKDGEGGEVEAEVVKKKKKLRRKKGGGGKKKKKKVEVEAEGLGKKEKKKRKNPNKAFTMKEIQEVVEQADVAINSVKKGELIELKSLKRPPEPVLKTFEALCVLMGEPRTWSAATKLMVVGKGGLVERLKAFDKDNVDEATLEAMKELLKEEIVEVGTVRKASSAAAGVCLWCHAITNYAEMIDYVVDKGGVEGVGEGGEEGVEEVREEEAAYSPNPAQMKEKEIRDLTNAPILETPALEVSVDLPGGEVDPEGFIDGLRDEEKVGNEDELLDFMLNSDEP
jgi:hypothetical protein